MIGHVFKLHTLLKWKRFAIIFLLAAIIIYGVQPVYIDSTVPFSMSDWLLEVSGSLLAIYFFASFAVIFLSYDATQWLWTSFGTSSLTRISKRSSLFWSYVLLVGFIVTFVLLVIFFWAIIIGLFRFDGYTLINQHPYFALENSPILLFLSRWFIDWWALYFISAIGVLGAFCAKRVLFSFLPSVGWALGLLFAFKSNLSLKGFIPGEGMVLSIHEYGVSPLLLTVVNEAGVLIVLGVLYQVIKRSNLVVSRSNR